PRRGRQRRRAPRPRRRVPRASRLQEDLTSALVLEHLALHALERVVDRLRVAPELVGHLFVRRSFEVETQGVRLEPGKTRAEAEDEALQLLARDHAGRRLVDARPGQRVAQGHVALRILTGRSLAEGDVVVEGVVLEARRRLDGGDDLPRHAELREATERGLLVWPEVADGLAEPDQPFLEEVLGVAAREKVGARLHADEARVATDQRVSSALIAVARAKDELQILELTLSFLRRPNCSR